VLDDSGFDSTLSLVALVVLSFSEISDAVIFFGRSETINDAIILNFIQAYLLIVGHKTLAIIQHSADSATCMKYTI
jgi:hypothetical protein